jgi:hypothetical protein
MARCPTLVRYAHKSGRPPTALSYGGSHAILIMLQAVVPPDDRNDNGAREGRRCVIGSET